MKRVIISALLISSLYHNSIAAEYGAAGYGLDVSVNLEALEQLKPIEKTKKTKKKAAVAKNDSAIYVPQSFDAYTPAPMSASAQQQPIQGYPDKIITQDMQPPSPPLVPSMPQSSFQQYYSQQQQGAYPMPYQKPEDFLAKRTVTVKSSRVALAQPQQPQPYYTQPVTQNVPSYVPQPPMPEFEQVQIPRIESMPKPELMPNLPTQKQPTQKQPAKKQPMPSAVVRLPEPVKAPEAVKVLAMPSAPVVVVPPVPVAPAAPKITQNIPAAPSVLTKPSSNLPPLPKTLSAPVVASKELPKLPPLPTPPAPPLPAIATSNVPETPLPVKALPNNIPNIPSLPAPPGTKDEKTVGKPAPSSVAMAPSEINAAAVISKTPISSIIYSEAETEVPLADQNKLQLIADKMATDRNLSLNVLAYASGTSDQAGQATRTSLARGLAIRRFLLDRNIERSRINVKPLGNKSTTGVPDRVDLYLDKQANG